MVSRSFFGVALPSGKREGSTMLVAGVKSAMLSAKPAMNYGHLALGHHLHQLHHFSINWEAIGAIATAATVIYIAVQSKYLAYQVRPIAWFFPMSAKTLNTYPDERQWFFVKNESKYTVLFEYKIKYLRDDGAMIISPEKWSEPLHVYPMMMQYPGVLLTESELIGKAGGSKEIVAEISYRLAPIYAPTELESEATETWRFAVAEKTWTGPNGMPDRGMLPFLASK